MQTASNGLYFRCYSLMIPNLELSVPLRDTIEVIQSGQRRIKLFVDFWNVVINARSQCSKNFNVHLHWDKLVNDLIHQTRQGHHDNTNGELAGCYIFGSKSRSNPEESKFVDQTLDLYGSTSGLFFNFAERVPKQTSAVCSCGRQVKVQSERGIDVLLAVEMIKHASMREHEYLALVSSDRDFIPLLSFLRDQGQRVLHVATGSPDREMRSITWAQVNLQELYPNLCTIEHDDYIVLTAPSCEEQLKQVRDAAPEPDQLRVIDITDESQINDRDLAFLMSSLKLWWHISNKPNALFGYSRIASGLRHGLRTGELRGDLPCVVRNGVSQFRFDGTRWLRSAGGDPEQSWPKLFVDG